jgi:sterol desaturase/sphingolipid hydroxylase (fatty acid hydroxylase superfamily)
MDRGQAGAEGWEVCDMNLVMLEPKIRVGAFLAAVIILMTLEIFFPRRRLAHPRKIRWSGNIGIIIVGTLLMRLSPVIPVTAAVFAPVGLLSFVPPVLDVIIAILLLDLLIYFQHRLAHSWRPFWQLHKMHHTDLDIDFTTAVRFHPLEMVISLFIKVIAILILAPPVIAVIIFEVMLNVLPMFNHSNLRLPFWLDKALRRLLVTPDMHRVHHSIYRHENNSNFGFNLSVWDRIFGTYVSQPKDGHEKMTIGLPIFRKEKHLSCLYIE